MFPRAAHFPRFLSACCTLALLAAGSPQTAAAGAAERLPKPVPVPPGKMPPLPPAEIDDTLAIGGKEIDTRKVRTRMTASVRVNGAGPYRFVVDSGADSSVIGTRIARALQLPQGTPVTLNAMTGSARVPRVLVDEIGLGETSVSNLELPVLEESHLGGEGMLGIDALVRQRLMLDFEKRIITVEDAAKPPPRMEGEIIVTARLSRGQLILTRVKANDLPIDAVVDTGSEISIGNMALRDKIIRRRAGKIEKIAVTGVTGATVDLEIARVRELRLGSVILHNVPIAFAEVPPFAVFGLTDRPSLLLGTDLMETFRRVSLDFRARKARFQLRRCQSTGIAIATMPGTLARLSAAQGADMVCKK